MARATDLRLESESLVAEFRRAERSNFAGVADKEFTVSVANRHEAAAGAPFRCGAQAATDAPRSR
jgi:hypothetical protein